MLNAAQQKARGAVCGHRRSRQRKSISLYDPSQFGVPQRKVVPPRPRPPQPDTSPPNETASRQRKRGSRRRAVRKFYDPSQRGVPQFKRHCSLRSAPGSAGPLDRDVALLDTDLELALALSSHVQDNSGPAEAAAPASAGVPTHGTRASTGATPSPRAPAPLTATAPAPLSSPAAAVAGAPGVALAPDESPLAPVRGPPAETPLVFAPRRFSGGKVRLWPARQLLLARSRLRGSLRRRGDGLARRGAARSAPRPPAALCLTAPCDLRGFLRSAGAGGTAVRFIEVALPPAGDAGPDEGAAHAAGGAGNAGAQSPVPATDGAVSDDAAVVVVPRSAVVPWVQGFANKQGAPARPPPAQRRALAAGLAQFLCERGLTAAQFAEQVGGRLEYIEKLLAVEGAAVAVGRRLSRGAVYVEGVGSGVASLSSLPPARRLLHPDAGWPGGGQGQGEFSEASSEAQQLAKNDGASLGVGTPVLKVVRLRGSAVDTFLFGKCAVVCRPRGDGEGDRGSSARYTVHFSAVEARPSSDLSASKVVMTRAELERGHDAWRALHGMPKLFDNPVSESEADEESEERAGKQAEGDSDAGGQEEDDDCSSEARDAAAAAVGAVRDGDPRYRDLFWVKAPSDMTIAQLAKLFGVSAEPYKCFVVCFSQFGRGGEMEIASVHEPELIKGTTVPHPTLSGRMWHAVCRAPDLDTAENVVANWNLERSS